jgi:protein-tyrosine phosphatase
MIDLHSHILTAIVEGFSSIDKSLDMLRIAIYQVVITQVLTPHIHSARFGNLKEHIEQAFIKLKKQANTANLPIKLLLGAKLLIGPEIIRLISTNAVLWLGEFHNKKTILLKFPRTVTPFGSDNLVRWLLSKNCLSTIVYQEKIRLS